MDMIEKLRDCEPHVIVMHYKAVTLYVILHWTPNYLQTEHRAGLKPAFRDSFSGRSVVWPLEIIQVLKHLCIDFTFSYKQYLQLGQF